MEGNGMVRARWDNDEDWTETYSEREWNEMMKQAYKILAPKDNEDLLRRLIVAIPKKSIVNRLET